MLVGRALGELSEADIFSNLQNDEAWCKSDLFELPVSRRGLLSEAWFYEAMLAKAEGNTARMQECLRRCLGADYPAYFEYQMAKFI